MSISQFEVNINCPKCKKEISVQIKQMSEQSTVVCKNCKSKIELVDGDGSVKKVEGDINNSMKRLDKMLKSF